MAFMAKDMPFFYMSSISLFFYFNMGLDWAICEVGCSSISAFSDQASLRLTL